MQKGGFEIRVSSIRKKEVKVETTSWWEVK